MIPARPRFHAAPRGDTAFSVATPALRPNPLSIPSAKNPDWFQPTWPRAALAAAVAAGAFLLPQELPLQYYPLNDPSPGVMQLEITCASSVSGIAQVFLDNGRGFLPENVISWPMAPSAQAYTYNFPLPDAPLLGLRLDPFFNGPGEFTITNLRLIERHGAEIRRFTKDDFRPLHQISAIEPLANGWKLVAPASADDPYAFLEFPQPIAPAGMNGRNLQRCLLSWGYLGLMLWILLLAVYFIVRRPGNGRSRREVGERAPAPEEGGKPDAGDSSGLPPPASGPAQERPGRSGVARDAAFLALIALLFAAAGNRGLIKESIRCARWSAPPIHAGMELQFDLSVDAPSPAQLFWDTGAGFNQAESVWCDYEHQPGLQPIAAR